MPHAQAHFVGRTREVEVVAVVSAPRELAAVGPLFYREQAEWAYGRGWRAGVRVLPLSVSSAKRRVARETLASNPPRVVEVLAR